MATLAAQGRWLGGRPPYGYRLAPSGKDEKRLKRLEIDPEAGPVVQRIYRDYLAGKGIRIIADELTVEGIPSPAAHDRRNSHWVGTHQGAWGKSAVRSVLIKPSYMGKRVFGRQRRADVLFDPADASMGTRSRMKNTSVEGWVFPADDTHAALVTPELPGGAGTFRRPAGRSGAEVAP